MAWNQAISLNILMPDRVRERYSLICDSIYLIKVLCEILMA